MTLGVLMRRHADALTADFRRYYGARVRDFGAVEAADLAANLPRESACMRALNPACEWGDAEYLLWRVEFYLRAMLWARTEDARSGANAPRPLPNPAEAARYEELSSGAMFESVASALGIELEGGDEDG